MTGVGIEGLEGDLHAQRRAIGARVPVYDRLLGELLQLLDGRVGERLQAAWDGRQFHVFWDRPLLLLGALRFDALAEGPAHPLWSALVAERPDVEAATAGALRAALAPERASVWHSIADRHVQTNETSRAVTWLWPAYLAGADRGGRALALADVGASAGLNLVADALPSPWTTLDGAPLPVASQIRAVARLGLDVRPLDACDEEQARWLRACVWPGQAERLERLDAAIAAFRAASSRQDRPRLETLVATDFPGRLARLSAEHPEALVLAYQSIVRGYIGGDDLSTYERGMHEWLAAVPAASAAWIEFEMSSRPADADRPVDLVAHVAAGGESRSLHLARLGYHPTAVEVLPEADAFRRLLQTP